MLKLVCLISDILDLYSKDIGCLNIMIDSFKFQGFRL